MQVNRRLYRCRQNRRLAGVAGGVAEFFGIDPTLVRVLWFLSIFAGGFSILLYIALALFVPLEPVSAEAAAGVAAAGGEGTAGVPSGQLVEAHRHAARGTGDGRVTTFVGVVLILIGGLALVGAVLPDVSWRYLWPVFLVGLGALLVVAAIRRQPTEL
jgi:phage shock protein PspC (stress-responsive transcriptional regulator)